MKKFVALVCALVLVAAACGGDDDGGDNSGASASGGGGDWCALAQRVEDINLFGDDSEFNPFDASGVEDLLNQALDAFDEAVDVAPNEIKDDIVVVQDTFEALVDKLDEVDYDFLQLSESDLADLNSDRFQEATSNIQQYNQDVCGISSSSSDDDSAVSADDDVPSGDDDGSSVSPAPPPASSGDDDDSASNPTDATFREQIVNALTGVGFTDDEANCLVDNLDMESFDAEQPDVSALLGIFGECDISMNRLAELGG